MKRPKSKDYADRVIEEEENKMVKRKASIDKKLKSPSESFSAQLRSSRDQ